MPTTQLHFAGTCFPDWSSLPVQEEIVFLSSLISEIKENSNDEIMLDENVRNDEIKLEAEFDEEIETEINQSYRVNDSYDMTNGDPFYEYQLQLDKMVDVTASQNMTANVPRFIFDWEIHRLWIIVYRDFVCRDFDEIFRPLSRASLVTDAEIDANQAMSRELSNIESQFYPDDDQY